MKKIVVSLMLLNSLFSLYAPPRTCTFERTYLGNNVTVSYESEGAATVSCPAQTFHLVGTTWTKGVTQGNMVRTVEASEEELRHLNLLYALAQHQAKESQRGSAS